jgi:hypothetical protein
MAGITTVSLGDGKPAFFDKFPLLNQSTWSQVWAVFPFKTAFEHPILAEKLESKHELRTPQFLGPDSLPETVNAFLEALNKVFPRTLSGNKKIGRKTNGRECPAADTAALERMFPAFKDQFSTFKVHCAS